MVKLKRLIVVLFFSVGGFFLTNQTVLANEELIRSYNQLDSILHIYDGWLWQDFLRAMGWGLIRTLVWLNNYLESIVNKIIRLNDFYSSDQMMAIMDVVKPIVFGLFLVAIIVLGYQFMLNKIEKRNEVLLNVLLATSMLVIVPVLMSSLDDIASFGFRELNSSRGTLADGVVKSNVADIAYYAQNDFEVASFTTKYIGDESTPPRPINRDNSNIGTSEYKYGNTLPIDNTKLYVIEKMDDSDAELLKNKAVPDGSGNTEVVELRDNQVPFTSLGEESYYRYHVSWTVIIFTLIITAVALAITIIKLGRAIFDLAFHQIFALFVSVTDLTGGQRIKKVLAEIANTFGVMFVMVLILKIFIAYAQWVNGLKPSIGAVGVILMLIAGAWAVIDAPDIVQRIMGIDAGLRSGYGAMMGAYAGAKMAGGLAKGAGNLATGSFNLGKGFLGGVKGSGNSGKESEGSNSIPSQPDLSSSSLLSSMDANESNQPTNGRTNSGKMAVGSGKNSSNSIPDSTSQGEQTQDNRREKLIGSGNDTPNSIPDSKNEDLSSRSEQAQDQQGKREQNVIPNSSDHQQSIDYQQTKKDKTRRRSPLQSQRQSKYRSMPEKIGYGLGRTLNVAGRMAKSITVGTARAAIFSARAIQHPRHAINYGKSKITSATKSIISEGSRKIERGGRAIRRVAKEIRTPLGAESNPFSRDLTRKPEKNGGKEGESSYEL